MDILSEVLQLVRLNGAVLFRAELSAPWCVQAPSGEVLASALPGPASHAITFHVVLDGEFTVACERGAPLRLRSGEAVVLAHGDPHRFGDELSPRPVPVTELFEGRPVSRLRNLRYGGGGAGTRILCGFLGCERAAFAPLFAALPAMFKVDFGPGRTPPLAPLLDWAEREAVERRAGAAGVRVKMAELLFVEALRRHIDALPADGHGWLAALRDPVLGRALALLHECPARHWDVCALAHESAVSRSALADRFVRVIGESPMHYLAHWRMQLAARQLRESHDSVEAVAAAVGYESTAAFQRAFKRWMGATPAQWRRGAPAAILRMRRHPGR